MDQPPAPTRRDDEPLPPTRRDQPGAGDDFDRQLPKELAMRFDVVEPFPARGSEADLFLVKEKTTGRRVVLKLYRLGIPIDSLLSERLSQLTPQLAHCVTVFDFGTAGERSFEVQEFVEGASLPVGEPWSPAQIADLVRQLADTLDRLHEHGIVHRDLKPDNILVRERDPLNLAVCDFGISRWLKMTVEFTRAAGTLPYLPPEALAGPEVRVSSAWDWWALGMVVRTMVTRKAPDLGLSEAVFRAGLATRPVDLTGVVDPRTNLLCRGLLTRDPARRWNSDQVSDWLRGGSPRADDVAEPNAARGTGERITWPEQEFTTTASFAEAISADWDGALEYFCPPDLHDSAGLDWGPGLRRLVPRADPAVLDRAGALLIDRTTPPAIRLLRLMRLLDPDCPPAYRGYRLDGAEATILARIAVDHSHSEHSTAVDIVADLRESDLLDELSDMHGGHRLRIVAHNWRQFTTRWRRGERASLEVPDAWLLYLAADPRGATQRLQDRLHADARLMNVQWFADLVRSQDPLDQVWALHRIGEAERAAR